MNTNVPGTMNSIDGRMSPDIQAAFHIFAAHWRKVNEQWQYPLHTHPMFEINVVLQGEQHMTVNGQSYNQQSGDILFIHPGTPHSSQGPGPSGSDMTYYCLHFDIDDLTLRRALLTTNSVCLSGNTPEIKEIRSALDNIISSTILSETADSHRTRLATLHASLQLLTALSGWVLSEMPQTVNRIPSEATENTVALANAIERLLQQTVAAAEATGERDGGIETIAARLGYSTTHCNRAFHQIYGLSPRQYLSGLISRQAKLLLMDNNLSVDSIARRLGYRDVSHFSKQFKRWTGLSPAGYRRLSHDSSSSLNEE
ncbi:AraC family transcriptional regulator [Paenibacillus sp. sgz500958]|uniref:AraC family transcriptional regulator n=1 Tax=Paenibacillus sp. sgz500958 TaxID=3242475 RepID=UPI0036D3E04A